MSFKTARLIFLTGTLSSAILFLALTWDTHRQIRALTNADRLSDKVIARKKVFQNYNCNDCHTILGFGGYYAPDLTRVYQRRGNGYIKQVIAAPEQVLARSFRKMPQQKLSAEEIDYLINFLGWVNDIDNHDWPPQDSKSRSSRAAERLISGTTLSYGASLFKENNCFDCHQIQGAGGSSGPMLDDVGLRLSVDQIINAIANPQQLNPDSQMPAYENILSRAEIEALADFLAKQKGGKQ
ncbi:MAG: c-type cytochrome [Candidatus Aminicenantales bacterium]